MAGFGLSEKTTHLLDYNAKKKVEKQVCQERAIEKSFCMYLKEMEKQKIKSSKIIYYKIHLLYHNLQIFVVQVLQLNCSWSFRK